MDEIAAEFANFLEDDSPTGNTVDDRDVINELFGDDTEPQEGEEAEEEEGRQIKMVNVLTDDDITKVKKPKRINLKLDLDKLFSDRGVSAIPNHVNCLKLKGKGHELEDITKICKAYEHWAHRLYPKMTFKDVLEKVEQLGLKNRKKCFNKKMEINDEARRMNLVIGKENIDDDNAEDPCFMDAQEVPPDSTFTEPTRDTSPPPSSRPSFSPPPPPPQSSSPPPPSLTTEQVERMRQNRIKAMERKKHRESGIGSNNSLAMSPLARSSIDPEIPSRHDQSSDSDSQAPSKRFKMGEEVG